MIPSPAISRRGAGFALLAYGAWGLFPIYWKGFDGVPAVEVIAHRLVWSLVFLGGLVAASGGLGDCARVFRAPRLLGVLALSAALLSFNWGLFVHGVNTNQIVETSLGYFFNPLVNVALGALVLRERLSRRQWFAVALAAAGVAAFGWHIGRLPWIALGIAASFGLYGLVRKMAPVAPLPGLVVETALMAPIALALILVPATRGDGHFFDSAGLTLLFLGGGVVTAFPLIWFISAAKLLPLSTLGFFQYLAPTLQLLLGVALYREPFTLRDGLAFGLIWTAIALFLSAGRPRQFPAKATES